MGREYNIPTAYALHLNRKHNGLSPKRVQSQVALKEVGLVERRRRCLSLSSGQSMSYSRHFNRDVDAIGGIPRPSHQLYWVSPHPHTWLPGAADDLQTVPFLQAFSIMQNSPNCPLLKVCLEDESCAGQESYFISSCKNIILIPRAKLSLFGNSWDHPASWIRSSCIPQWSQRLGGHSQHLPGPTPWCLWPHFSTSSPIIPLYTLMTQPKASTVQLFKNTCYISCFLITRGQNAR